jgi:four helix bundle protein
MDVPESPREPEPNPLLTRTKQFSLRVMRLVDSLPRRRSTDVVANQLVRCATSVGANYRAARRARSTAEFIAKLGICEEEADESVYWLELLIDSEVVKAELLGPLLQEANEITAMIVASIRTAKGR